MSRNLLSAAVVIGALRVTCNVSVLVHAAKSSSTDSRYSLQLERSFRNKRISSDKADHFPKRDVLFILLK